MSAFSYTQALAQTLQPLRINEQERDAGAKLCDGIFHCNTSLPITQLNQVQV